MSGTGDGERCRGRSGLKAAHRCSLLSSPVATGHYRRRQARWPHSTSRAGCGSPGGHCGGFDCARGGGRVWRNGAGRGQEEGRKGGRRGQRERHSPAGRRWRRASPPSYGSGSGRRPKLAGHDDALRTAREEVRQRLERLEEVSRVPLHGGRADQRGAPPDPEPDPGRGRQPDLLPVLGGARAGERSLSILVNPERQLLQYRWFGDWKDQGVAYTVEALEIAGVRRAGGFCAAAVDAALAPAPVPPAPGAAARCYPG